MAQIKIQFETQIEMKEKILYKLANLYLNFNENYIYIHRERKKDMKINSGNPHDN